MEVKWFTFLTVKLNQMSWFFTSWDTLMGGHSCESCQKQTNQTNLQTNRMSIFSNLEEIKLCIHSKSHCFPLCVVCRHSSLVSAQNSPLSRQALLPVKEGGWWIPARSHSVSFAPSQESQSIFPLSHWPWKTRRFHPRLCEWRVPSLS